MGTSAFAKKAGGELIDEAMELADMDLDGGTAAAAREYDVAAAVRGAGGGGGGPGGAGPRAPACMSAQTLEAMIDCISEFFKRQPSSGKCQNCGCHNPAIKK